MVKWFDGKLIVLQTLFNINNKPLPWGVYGIPPGAILAMWFTSIKSSGSCMLIGRPSRYQPSQMGHGWYSYEYD